MKRIKWLISGVVVLTILCFFVVPKVSAQALDGQWFRLSCVLKAYEVLPTGEFEKFNAKFVAYLGFTYIMTNVDGSRNYDLAVWTETAPGTWTNSFNINHNTIIANENFLSDLNLHFVGEGGVVPDTGPWVEVFITPAIIPTRRNISFIATGEVSAGLSDLGNEIYGGITIKGVNVDPTKLPFMIP